MGRPKLHDSIRIRICNWWGNINRHTVNGLYSKPGKRNRAYFRKGIRVEMSRQEFALWCEQHKSQILNMISAGVKPSIDRIDSRDHYKIVNLRIVPLSVNCAGGATSRANEFTHYLNSLPQRYCLNCDTLIQRKQFQGKLTWESESKFLARKCCNKSCAISYRNRTLT